MATKIAGVKKTGSANNDKLEGTAGDDTLLGGGGNDQLLGGLGDDILDGGTGNDRLDGGAGRDVLIYVAADNRKSHDEYDGGTGIDTLRLNLTLADFVRADVQNDIGRFTTFVSSHSNSAGEVSADAFKFAAFDLTTTRMEVLQVNVGSTAAVIGTRNADSISGTDNSDYISTLGGNDAVNGHGGSDVIFGGDGDDNLSGAEGDDLMDGGAGNDTLSDSDGRNAFFGGAGDDLIQSFATAAFIDGGAGNDFITAFQGEALDIRAGAGNDTIQAGSSGSFYIDAGDGNDSVQASFAGPAGGTILGGAGNDVIETPDYLSGFKIDAGTGDDTIIGGSVITTGKGIDTVWVSAVGGQTVTDFSAGRGGDRLSIERLLDNYTVGWDGSTNPFAAGFLRVVQSGKNALLQFDVNGVVDGHNYVTLTTLSNTNAKQLTGDNFDPGYDPSGKAPVGKTINGTAGDDTLTGTIGADKMYGLGGKDNIYGGRGADLIDGGAGDDVLDGAYGNDTLIGGLGNDTLIDGAGNNRMLGGLGDDYIQSTATGGRHTIEGGDGNDTVFVAGAAFADIKGGAGDDSLSVFFSDSATLDGGAGNDLIFVTAPPNQNARYTVFGGDGNDQITLEGDATVDAGAGNDTIYSSFAWLSHTIKTGTGADTIYVNGSLSHQLVVTDFTGGAGGDMLNVQSVLDRAIGWNFSSNPFALGFLHLQQSGTDTLVQFDQDGAANGQNFVTFATLQNLNASQVTSANFVPVYDPHEVITNRTFTGTEDSDTLFDGPGNDSLYGLGGADVLVGSTGDDLLDGGEGDDYLSDTEGDNHYIGGGGNDYINTSTGHSVIEAGADNDQVSISGQSTVDLGAGDDHAYLNAGSGGSVVALGTGQDTVHVMSATPYGSTITGFEAGPTGDILDVSPLIDTLGGYDFSVNPFVARYLSAVQSGTDTYVLVDTDGPTNGESFQTLAILQNVNAADLTYWNFGQSSFDPAAPTPTGLILGSNYVDDITGDDGDNSIYGFLSDDFLRGAGGNDILRGGGGNDWLEGGEGNDDLQDYSGYNQFFGGGGDDYIRTGLAPYANIDSGSGNDNILTYADFSTISAGEGDDSLLLIGMSTTDAGAGDDRVDLAGASGHIITLGTGSDILSVVTVEELARVTDFNVADDYLDLRPTLYSTPTAATIGSFVSFSSDGAGGTRVAIDPDGTGTDRIFTNVLVLENTAGLNVMDMFNSGHLLVA